ncbi:MAG: hypothetical protein NC307_11300 [Roseburia sp.]|nr:hypothetical protein [Roseburia sp.]
MKKHSEEQGYASIEELKAKLGTTDAVFEGAKTANGWKMGKMMTEKEFAEAVRAFEAAPMDGRESRKDVQ